MRAMFLCLEEDAIDILHVHAHVQYHRCLTHAARFRETGDTLVAKMADAFDREAEIWKGLGLQIESAPNVEVEPQDWNLEPLSTITLEAVLEVAERMGLVTPSKEHARDDWLRNHVGEPLPEHLR